jgi:hypothetical protein
MSRSNVATTRRIIDELVRMDRAYGDTDDYDPWEEEPWPQGLDAFDLAESLAEAERIHRIAKLVINRLRAHMTADVREHGAIRIGDQIYAPRPDRVRRLIDRDSFIEWAGPDLARCVRVDGSNVRITQVREVAEARGVDAQAVEDSFFSWEDRSDGWTLTILPMGSRYTPKWAESLAEGERRG